MGELLEQTETSFVSRHEISLPVSPDAAYEAATGDLRAWWDHTMFGAPETLYLDARAGGHFLEEKTKGGDSVLHATVIFAEKGKRLTYRGPLGFNLFPLSLVVSLTFDPGEATETTKLTVITRGLGAVPNPSQAFSAIDQVMAHFYGAQLKKYLSASASEEMGS